MIGILLFTRKYVSIVNDTKTIFACNRNFNGRTAGGPFLFFLRSANLYFCFLAFRYALKLLHSSSVDSTEKIRNSLDDLIKQRHGASKMLANTLSKKYLAEESSAPGVVQRHRSSDSKASSSNSPQQITVTTADSNSVVTTPIVISVPDDDDDDDLMEEAHLQVMATVLKHI